VIRGQDWARILKENNLEPPGYDEAVKETMEAVKRRKLAEEDRLNKKAKRKPKKKR